MNPPAQPNQVAAASRWPLFWLVVGIVALNLFLFLKFGVQRKSPPAGATNSVPVLPSTNGMK
ncbi:MAG: hypothetical protein EPO07_02280 [Verrucomicrobia bacterium]|nr:MAG: hypothetical protein EPO07_02280 [Verrucomicrobiota bacterium]